MELLVIYDSFSDRRIIFVPWLLKFFHVLVVLQLAWVRTSLAVELDNAIRFSTLPGCLGSSGIVLNEPAGSAISFNIRQGLKC